MLLAHESCATLRNNDETDNGKESRTLLVARREVLARRFSLRHFAWNFVLNPPIRMGQTKGQEKWADQKAEVSTGSKQQIESI